MGIQTEAPATGECIISEANGHYSRESGLLAAGNLQANTVLGQLDADDSYVQLDPDADPADGSEGAVAILYAAVDATDGPQPCVVLDSACEVDGDVLIWPEGITEPQKAAAIAELRAAGIKVR